MATASGNQCKTVFRGQKSKWGEKREEASPSPSQADMWYSCWAVTRTHHTHRLCSHPMMHRLKIPPLVLLLPPSAPFLPHSLPLTCQFLSWLPLANTVINLLVCLPHWQNQWAVLGAGVDTAAEYKARATWLEYTVTSVPLANSEAHLCLCEIRHNSCLWNPQGGQQFFWETSLLISKKNIVLVTSEWIHEKLSTEVPRESRSDVRVFACIRVWKDEGEIKASPGGFQIILPLRERTRSSEVGCKRRGEKKQKEKERRQLFI